MELKLSKLLTFVAFTFLTSNIAANNGLAPEVTDLNAEDISFQKEKEIPYLEKPFISTSPKAMNDQLKVGKLGIDGGKEELVLKYVRELAKKSEDPKSGKTDSLLIAYKNKLLFESYFRRGRRNYPHYQMSITKSYTAYAIGRAIQLGHLSMDDLHKPVVWFLKEIKPEQLAKGTEKITLNQAMQMRSGIRLPKKKIGEIIQRPSILLGQGQARAYLQFSQDLPDLPDSSLQTNPSTFYGYFWWRQTLDIEDRKYDSIQGRGAGGQFIFIIPTLELVISATAHNQGMGKMRAQLPHYLIPAFSKN